MQGMTACFAAWHCKTALSPHSPPELDPCDTAGLGSELGDACEPAAATQRPSDGLRRQQGAHLAPLFAVGGTRHTPLACQHGTDA